MRVRFPVFASWVRIVRAAVQVRLAAAEQIMLRVDPHPKRACEHAQVQQSAGPGRPEAA